MRLRKWFVSISVLAAAGAAVGWLWAEEEIVPGFGPSSPETATAPTIAPAQGQIPHTAGTHSVPDLFQAQPTEPHPVPEPPPAAAQIEVPAPAANPPQIPAPPTAADGVRSDAYLRNLGPNPEEAARPLAETPAPPAATAHRDQTVRAGAPAANPVLLPQGLQTLVDERRDQLRRERNARLDAYRGPRRHMPPWFEPYDDAVERYRNARRSQYRRQRGLRRQRHASWMDTICPWPKTRRDRSTQRSYQRQMEQLDHQAYRDTFIYRPPYGFAGPGGWR